MLTFLLLKLIDALYGKRPHVSCFNCHGTGRVSRFQCPVCDGTGVY